MTRKLWLISVSFVEHSYVSGTADNAADSAAAAVQFVVAKRRQRRQEDAESNAN